MSGFTGGSSSAGAAGASGDVGDFVVVGYFTSNIALTGAQTVTGGTAANGDIVLVGGQTDNTQNGIYTVNTGGAWSRLAAYTGALVQKCKIRLVCPSTGIKGATIACTTTATPVTIGSTALTYAWEREELTSASYLFIRQAVGAGNANIEFCAVGGDLNTASGAATIQRGSGANGSWDFNQSGSGDMTFYSPVSTAQFFFQNSPVIANGGFGSSNTVITSGTSSTLTIVVSCAIFNPAATIASYTLTLPTSPKNGTRIKIAATNVSGGAVTALTLTPGGTNTIDGAITSLAANAFAEYMFVSSIGASGKWVRIG